MLAVQIPRLNASSDSIKREIFKGPLEESQDCFGGMAMSPRRFAQAIYDFHALQWRILELTNANESGICLVDDGKSTVAVLLKRSDHGTCLTLVSAAIR